MREKGFVCASKELNCLGKTIKALKQIFNDSMTKISSNGESMFVLLRSFFDFRSKDGQGDANVKAKKLSPMSVLN